MFRSLIPFSLVLSLLPSVALAAPEDKPEAAAASTPDVAERGSRKASKGDSKKAKGERRSSRQRKGSSDARPAERAPREAARPAARGPEAARGAPRGQPTTRHIDTRARTSSAGAQPAARHAPPNYRSSARHAGSSSAQAAAGSHRGRSPQAVAAAHRSASRHAAAATHHDAWARHGRHGGWARPWRPGHPHHWYHGVFVYGPPRPVVVVDGRGGGGGGEGRSDEAAAPKRKVDRARTFAVGLRGGSYMSGYHTGDVYGDAGMGLAVRYRPVEAVGFELDWQHHDATWDEGSERQFEPVQASVQLFGMPWTKVNPYALVGVTVTGREVNDQLGPVTVAQTSPLWGPHAGLGLELGLGEKASVNFDARWIGYLNKPEDDLSRAGAMTANMGLNFYF